MNRRRHAVLFTAVLLVGACLSSTDPELCAGGAPLSDSSCLDTTGLASLEPAHRDAVDRSVRDGFARVTSVLPVEGVRVEVLADASRAIPEVGIGGFNPSSDRVQIFVDPDFADFSRAVEEELPRTLAHELHHALRRRSVGYGETLAEAMITEGLADHFSLEVFGGEPPPWSVALRGEDLEHWTGQTLAASAPGYDHARWFFGARGDVPRWTGYAVGFALVADFLAANPGRRPSELVDEEAAVLLAR